MNLINTIDTAIYNLIIKLMSTNTTAIMIFISHLGSAVTLIILAIAFILLLKNKRNAKYISINLALVFVINRILKFIIARPRPQILRLVSENGYSFPSRTCNGFNGVLWIFDIFDLYEYKKEKYKIFINNIFEFNNTIYRNKSYIFRSALFYGCNRWIYNSNNIFEIIYKTHV